MASGPSPTDRVHAADTAAAVDALAALAAVRRREPIFWTFQAVFWTWTVLALVAVNQIYQPNGGNSFATIAARLLIGVFLSSCVHWLNCSRPVQRLGWKLRWMIAVAGSIVMVIVWLLLLSYGVVGAALQGAGPLLYFPLFGRVFVAGAWLAVYLGLDALQRAQQAERRMHGSELRAAQAEASARASELRRLEAQMNPHFLFNALNCVVAASRDHVAVERVTQDLADYLRFSLEPAQPLEPLSRELDALEKYLFIQQSRFGAGLICRIGCEPEARSVLVPPMMIQPLLENAFHYGAQTSQTPLTVSVTASRRAGELSVIVANSGAWVPPDSTRSIGSGIQTLRKRLGLLLGPAATAEVVCEEGWVKIVIRLPDTGQRGDHPILPAITA